MKVAKRVFSILLMLYIENYRTVASLVVLGLNAHLMMVFTCWVRDQECEDLIWFLRGLCRSSS